MYQNWSLAIPALLLPFDVLWKVLFKAGFPLRFLILLAFGLTTYFFSYAYLLNREPGSSHPNKYYWILATGLILLFCSPTFTHMPLARMHVYEEAILMGNLWALFLLGCLILYQKKGERRFVS